MMISDDAMVELSRRLFLIGSASAIAVASAAMPATARPAIIPVPAANAFKLRRVWGLGAAFESYAGPDDAALIEISRSGGSPLFKVGLSTRGYLRWCAPASSHAWLVAPDYALQMSVSGTRAIGHIELECEDTVDDGPPVSRVERHIFSPVGRSVEVLECYLDNSLEARLERAKPRPQMEWDGEADEDNDDD